MANERSGRTRQIIQSFEAKALKRRRWDYRLADNLTFIFGSISFLFLNAAFATVWILINEGVIGELSAFDPYPFVMLTTILSLEAIFLTIAVLISQIRQNQTTTLRSELQLQVSLITEKELTKLLKLVRMVLRKQGVDVANDTELEEMIGDIDASYIERKLEEEIIPSKPSLTEKLVEPFTKIETKAGHSNQDAS